MPYIVKFVIINILNYTVILICVTSYSNEPYSTKESKNSSKPTITSFNDNPYTPDWGKPKESKTTN